ncbi:MAG: CoA-transferase [Myxococcota bacterium]|nr:CoA-transferase [Myxococcota bacterium]
MSEPTRADFCIAAIADAFRGDGEIMVSPFGNIPALGVRLAKLSFEPDLLITDGIASLVANVMPVGAQGPDPVVEGWMPFRTVFDTLWSGRRHVMMGASQIDRFGNQNFACIGPYEKPKAQLLGMRGAPGNTMSHTTSYWVPNHGPKVFVEKVDVVSGVGYDRAAALGPRTSRFHEIRRVVTNLCVLDFQTPDHSMRLASIHPGVGVDEVVEKTGFALTLPEEVPETRAPSGEELRLIREVLDPNHIAEKELLG